MLNGQADLLLASGVLDSVTQQLLLLSKLFIDGLKYWILDRKSVLFIPYTCK